VTLNNPSLLPSEALVEKLEGIPVGQHIVLVLHQDHFSEALADFLATEPRAIYRDPDVRFSEGQVEVQGEIRVLGVWVSAIVWGNLQAQDCHVKATITDLSVGSLLTPTLVREEARKRIHGELEKAVDALFETLPVCLERIELQDGVAIVEGTRRRLE
jgi:hypothetical protein